MQCPWKFAWINFDFHGLNSSNRLVNCQKILLIKHKLFNILGNLTLIQLLIGKKSNVSWLSLRPSSSWLIFFPEESSTALKMFRCSRVLIFCGMLFSFVKPKKHQAYRLSFHRVVTCIAKENHSLNFEDFRLNTEFFRATFAHFISSVTENVWNEATIFKLTTHFTLPRSISTELDEILPFIASLVSLQFGLINWDMPLLSEIKDKKQTQVQAILD